jgi:hypothetical protein
MTGVVTTGAGRDCASQAANTACPMNNAYPYRGTRESESLAVPDFGRRLIIEWTTGL